MRTRPNLRLGALAITLLSPLLSAQTPSEQPPTQPTAKLFYLHEGDNVVFYGDSITEQRFYTYWVQVYTATRFPHMHVQFFNAGVGGDRVTGGAAGPIDERLSRDVFPNKPSVVTIMLGMNDGGYKLLTPQIESTYTQGYEHILASIEKSAPTARVSLLGPSPYDEVTRPPTFPGGYNTTLIRFSQIDRELATKHKATFIDLNAPFLAAYQRGVAINPTATEMLLPDRVHPEQLAHWFMAAAILKGWNAPALISSATLDATALTAIDLQNAHISEITGDATSLSWTELDDALPLPLDDNHAGYHFIRQLLPLDEELDQQPLTINNLKPGKYQLSIDSAVTGSFSDVELAKGINLALYSTPMRSQAYRVGWLTRDRDDTHYVRSRMLVNQMKTGLSAEPTATELTQFEKVQQQQIYDAAQPIPHKFKLTPIVPVAP